MKSKTPALSRRAFLSTTAATSAGLWIPKPVKGYTAEEAYGRRHRRGIRKDKVEVVWEITGRGKSQ